jgi:hypothetical protein
MSFIRASARSIASLISRMAESTSAVSPAPRVRAAFAPSPQSSSRRGRAASSEFRRRGRAADLAEIGRSRQAPGVPASCAGANRFELVTAPPFSRAGASGNSGLCSKNGGFAKCRKAPPSDQDFNRPSSVRFSPFSRPHSPRGRRTFAALFLCPTKKTNC